MVALAVVDNPTSVAMVDPVGAQQGWHPHQQARQAQGSPVTVIMADSTVVADRIRNTLAVVVVEALVQSAQMPRYRQAEMVVQV